MVRVTALGEKSSEGDVKYPDKGETLTIHNEEEFLAIQDNLPIQLQQAIVEFKGSQWKCADMVKEDFAKTVESAKTKEKDTKELTND